MRYGSVCSGVEAASTAWEPLGWEPVFFSEIEPFPSAVLAQHWPSVPNHGDMTKFEEWGYESGDIDVLVGGTPCQSFSIAGLRGGLEDDRGNLALTYMRMVDQLRPRWCVWENVPGVLSSNGGRDFGSIVGALAELGYSCAWRVLDAQNFGVPQRRRRVFLVGCASGNWRDPAQVLFESGCGGRDFAAIRGQKQKDTRGAGKGIAFDMQRLSEYGDGAVASTVMARDYKSATDLICFEPRSQDGAPRMHGTVSPTLNTAQGGQRQPCVLQNIVSYGVKTAHTTSNGWGIQEEKTHTLDSTGTVPACFDKQRVRRLTPTEAERLQGFPDGHTDICWKGKATPDSHRYKAMGNSMAVPVMRWIGERIRRHQKESICQ